MSNSQVAVFGALSNGDFASMVDARLYLPEVWCVDSVRCDEAGVPEEAREFKMKWELAIDIIAHQKSLGVNFDYLVLLRKLREFWLFGMNLNTSAHLSGI